jgi:hypothetical protein
MQFPEAGHPACTSWQPLPSWWLNQTNLLWDENSQSEFPHSVLTLIKYKGNYWLTNSQMVKYQSMLYENPLVWLEVFKTLNTATLLLVDSSPPAKLD